MKIRTDFVTNSSSSNSTEIMVDNPVLLGILSRYQDMGAFGEHKQPFGSGQFYLPPEVTSDEIPEEKRGFSITPAYYSYDEEAGPSELPTSLEDITEKLLIYCEYLLDSMDMEYQNQLKDELAKKKDEIEGGYVKVYWEYAELTNEYENPNIQGCRNVEIIQKFTYDRKNGAKFRYKVTDLNTDEILVNE